jgi:hypothetical protein
MSGIAAAATLARTLHVRRAHGFSSASAQGRAAHGFSGPIFGNGLQMDGSPRSADVDPGRAKALDGYTVHLLSLDGTITTVRRKRADDTTYEVTVELRDKKAARKLPAELAQNIRSAEFKRVVREVKAELLKHRGRRGRRRVR